MVRLDAGGVTGAWTVNRNTFVAVAAPSLTITEISDWPKTPAAGVIWTVRDWAAPPNTMFATGIRPGFEESAETVSSDTEVSGSSTANGNTGVAVSCGVVKLVRPEIVGGSSIETVNMRVIVLFCDWPSLTVTVIVACPGELTAGVKLRLPLVEGLV